MQVNTSRLRDMDARSRGAGESAPSPAISTCSRALYAALYCLRFHPIKIRTQIDWTVIVALTLMAEEHTRHERELVAEPAEPRLKRPPLYQVILLNDDYTPMEFVVDVLERIFGMDRTTATRVMLEVHTKGKGVCGVYTFEIAETKVAQVTTYARQHQHPLLCTMEEA